MAIKLMMLVGCSLSNVLSFFSALHIPLVSPAFALTLTWYTVPASSEGRRVEVVGGMVST